MKKLGQVNILRIGTEHIQKFGHKLIQEYILNYMQVLNTMVVTLLDHLVD